MNQRTSPSVRGGALVETTAGPIGIGWSARGLARVVLSDLSLDDEGVTSKRVASQGRAARSAHVVDALDRAGFSVEAVPSRIAAEWAGRLSRHVAGELVAFEDLDLDLDGLGDFARRVYAAAQRIPRGETWTYTQLGASLGTSRAPLRRGRSAPRSAKIRSRS